MTEIRLKKKVGDGPFSGQRCPQKLFQFLSYPTFSYFLNYQIHTQVRALLPNLFSTYYHIANKDIWDNTLKYNIVVKWLALFESENYWIEDNLPLKKS